jgi:hypothetical protein
MRKFLRGVLIGTILVPLGFFLVLWAGFWPIAATSQPPSWESHLALRALQASIKRRAPPSANPITASDENLLAGMKLTGMDAPDVMATPTGPARGTTSFYPRVPQFAQQQPRLTAPQMFWIVKHGVRYTGMGAGTDY